MEIRLLYGWGVLAPAYNSEFNIMSTLMGTATVSSMKAPIGWEGMVALSSAGATVLTAEDIFSKIEQKLGNIGCIIIVSDPQTRDFQIIPNKHLSELALKAIYLNIERYIK